MYSEDSRKEFTIKIGKLHETSKAFKKQMLKSSFFDYKKNQTSIPLGPLVLLGALGAGAVSSGLLSPAEATALAGGSLFAYTSFRDDFRQYETTNVLAYASGHAVWSHKQWKTLYDSFKKTVTKHDPSAVQLVIMGGHLYHELGEIKGTHSPIRVVRALQQAFEQIGIEMTPMNMSVFRTLSPADEHLESYSDTTFSP